MQIIEKKINELKPAEYNPRQIDKNALQAMIVAISEGKQDNSEYVKQLAYKYYEEDLNDS